MQDRVIQGLPCRGYRHFRSRHWDEPEKSRKIGSHQDPPSVSREWLFFHRTNVYPPHVGRRMDSIRIGIDNGGLLLGNVASIRSPDLCQKVPIVPSGRSSSRDSRLDIRIPRRFLLSRTCHYDPRGRVIPLGCIATGILQLQQRSRPASSSSFACQPSKRQALLPIQSGRSSCFAKSDFADRTSS